MFYTEVVIKNLTGINFPGVDIELNTWSSRLVLYATHFASTTLLASFSATLVSHLTVNEPQLPFTDFKSFYHDGTYGFGILKDSAQFDLV